MEHSEKKETRLLGYPLTLRDTSVDGLISKMAEIKSSIKQHGVVCIKGVGNHHFGAE